MRPVPEAAAETAARYRLFAETEARGLSPAYEALALGVADDPELLAVIDRLEPPKRQVNLVFGAARMLGAPVAPYAAFRAFVLARAEELLALARLQSTQTNEARRLATLLPYLGKVAESGAGAGPGSGADGRPLAIIEVGASAGLCLHPDRYSYVFSSPGAPPYRLDPVAGPSPVVLETEVRGSVVVPARIPTVVWRAGIDLNPLDPSSPDDLAWLEALVWPEHEERRARLRAAAGVAAAHPATIHRGDLLELLPAVVAQAPTDAQLVVFHTAVIAYLPREARARFVELMTELRTTRGVLWISNEGREVLPGVTVPAGVAPPEPSAFLLAVDGVPRAFTAPHGAWVQGF